MDASLAYSTFPIVVIVRMRVSFKKKSISSGDFLDSADCAMSYRLTVRIFLLFAMPINRFWIEG